VICFARQNKGESLRAAVGAYHEAARRSRIDYAFHLMITDPTREVIQEELPPLVAAGNRSIKVFMTYDVSRLSDAEVLQVFAAARRLKAMVCIHAEHHDIVEFYKAALVEAGLVAPKYHAWSRPMLVERESVHRAIALAEALDVPIQIFHLSGAASAEEVAKARPRTPSSETVGRDRQYRKHLRTRQLEGLLLDFEAVAVAELEPCVGAHLSRKGLLGRAVEQHVGREGIPALERRHPTSSDIRPSRYGPRRSRLRSFPAKVPLLDLRSLLGIPPRENQPLASLAAAPASPPATPPRCQAAE
jgi:hypothetical protein